MTINAVPTSVALALATWLAVVCGSILSPAFAHGERAAEPYLRTRTVQWFDVKWSGDKIKVNEKVTLTGRFRLMGPAAWPDAIAKPDAVFLSVTSPGPAFARHESYINGVPARQSARDLELGRDYEFSITLIGRVPGQHHIHPMLNVYTVGALVGPGKWLNVEGSLDDFKYPVKTLDNRTIDDLQTWGVEGAVGWHVIWIVLGAAWLLWWLPRPLLLPRWLALQKGREDLLVTRTDVIAGVVLAAIVLGVTVAGYVWSLQAYPFTVPLQSGKVKVEALERQPDSVKIKFEHASYDVPGRSMRISFRATNVTAKPLTLGEFTTANLRFIDQSVPAAVKAVDPGYPGDLIARGGLKTTGGGTLAPGETKRFEIEATDAAWEVERLTSFLTDVDSTMGGMLVFYDESGKRSLEEISGAILPVFTKL